MGLRGAISALAPAGLAALAVGILAAALTEPAQGPFPYDPLENHPLHCSKFFSLLEQNYPTKLLHSSYSFLLEAHPKSVLVLMGPTQPFTPEEVEALENFMLGGGVLVLIADNDGTGSSLTFGGIKISGHPLRDFGSFVKRPDFVLVTNLRPHRALEGVTSILTNYPSALVPLKPEPWAEVRGGMAWTSPASFLDQNRNGLPDGEEPRGPFALLAIQKMGKGYLVAIADPGIFVDDMLHRAQNERFARALFDWATKHGARPVIFDLTHQGARKARVVEAVVEFSKLGERGLVWSSALASIALTGSLAGTFAAHKLRGKPKLQALRHALGRLKPRRKPKGQTFSRELQRLVGKLDRFMRTDLREPLVLCYDRFLERCSRRFRLPPDPKQLLKLLEERFPQRKRVREVIGMCEKVKRGERGLDSPKTFRELVKTLLEFEREVGARA